MNILLYMGMAGFEMSSQKSSPGSPKGDITPFQQMMASCSGAVITSLLGKINILTCATWELFVNLYYP